jgi:tetratricopeptide (TPR) repeat protein
MRYFDFIVVVWGAGHTGVFLEAGLPSLLASGNLAGINARDRSRFQLFTRSDDLQKIEAAPVFRRLRELMAVDIELIDDWFDGAAPHAVMSRAHREALRRAQQRGADSVFVPPECVWADGSMVNLERIAACGARMVHMTGLRLVLEDVVPALIDGWRSIDGVVIAIPPRDLVRLGLPHLHPITKDNFFREHGTQMMPANLLWTVGNEGILARCFHLHPLLVEPNERNATFVKTIDDDLSLVTADDGSGNYLVADSDEIFAYELSSSSHRVTAGYTKASVGEVAAWAEVGTNQRHREFVETPIRLHVGEMTTIWASIEAEADAVVREALTLVGQPTAFLVRRYENVITHRVLAARYGGTSIADFIKAERIPIGLLPARVQAWAYQEIADECRVAGDLAGAIAAYSKAIGASDIRSTPSSMVGEAQPTDLAAAIAHYDQSVRLGRADPSLYYLRGAAQSETGDLKGALADFAAGLELAPDNAALRFMHDQTRLQIEDARGHALRAAGDLSGAIAHYDETVRAGRVDAALFYLRGTALMELGDLEAALADVNQGLVLDPENETFMFLCLHLQGMLAPQRPLWVRFLQVAIHRTGRFLDLIFGVGAGIRPWHWRWPYMQEVARPFARALAANPGTIMLIEDNEMPLAGVLRNLTEAPALTVWHPAELRRLVTDEGRSGALPRWFDVVVCRLPTDDGEWAETVERVGQLPHSSGKLLIVVSGRCEAMARRIIDERLPDFQLIERRPQGSLGTMVVTSFCNRLRRAISPQQTSPVASLLGLILLLPMYPMLSLMASLLNLLGRPGGICLETILILRRLPASIALGDGRARRVTRPELAPRQAAE